MPGRSPDTAFGKLPARTRHGTTGPPTFRGRCLPGPPLMPQGAFCKEAYAHFATLTLRSLWLLAATAVIAHGGGDAATPLRAPRPLRPRMAPRVALTVALGFLNVSSQLASPATPAYGQSPAPALEDLFGLQPIRDEGAGAFATGPSSTFSAWSA
jgi:hypothetical protein